MRIKLILFLLCFQLFGSAQIYTTINGQADFLSDAPLELIKASTDQLQGVLDIKKRTFAFKVFVKSFSGFNSPLQQVHFYENYMEVNEFPLSTFKGKILEELEEGKKLYRAKGTFDIHGVRVERIIEVFLVINEEKNDIEFNSEFTVALMDHDIDLPRIVYQKIAEVITVNVGGKMNLKE